jgi:hypothetical protein
LRNSPVGLYLLCFTNEEKNIILAPDLSARHQCALKTSKNNNSAGSPPCHLSLSFCRLFSPLEPVLAHMHNGSSLYSLSPPSPLRPIAILCFPVHFIPFFVLPSCLSWRPYHWYRMMTNSKSVLPSPVQPSRVVGHEACSFSYFALVLLLYCY